MRLPGWGVPWGMLAVCTVLTFFSVLKMHAQGASPSTGLLQAFPQASPATRETIQNVGGNEIFVVAIYLIVLATLVAGGLYVKKNGLTWPQLKESAERKLKVPEVRPLGNRQFILVVEYEETRVLLGVSPGRIDYLCPLDDGRAGAAAEFSAMLAKRDS